MQPATLNGLLSATQTEIPLPERAKELLSRDTILVRAIDRSSWYAMHPMVPDEVLEAPPEMATASNEEKDRHFQQRQRDWLRRVPADERVAYRLEAVRVKFRVIALAALEPRLTTDEATRLGEDAEEISAGILEFSGLLAKAPAGAKVGA